MDLKTYLHEKRPGLSDSSLTTYNSILQSLHKHRSIENVKSSTDIFLMLLLQKIIIFAKKDGVEAA